MDTDSLIKRAMQKIAAASAAFDTAEITRLNKLAEEIFNIQAMQMALKNDLEKIAEKLDAPPITPSLVRALGAGDASNGASSAAVYSGPLAITVDWRAIGLSADKQIICERYGSDTLRAFFEAIYARLGVDILGQLALIPVNRGKLLSRQPQKDFLNAKTGACYQHQRIGDSGWYVLTNSSAPEKIAIVRQVARALKFPPGTLTVQEVDTKRQLETILGV